MNSPITIEKVTSNEIQKLKIKSVNCRKSILQIVKSANAGHTGGSLSCVDILNVLYGKVMNITPENYTIKQRDHYVHSKGHSVEALYAVLAENGFFSKDKFSTVEKFDSKFIGHPTRSVPGIEQNTGALGHGLSFAVGMALALKMNHWSDRVFTIMGDGELAEGSVWEASMSAAHYHLDNLVAIIDRNTLQISGRTENVMALEPLEKKFESFGFAVRHVQGNDIAALVSLFSTLPFEKGKPNLIIAHTTKGKGISFMEDKVEWHHRVPTKTEFETAMQELDEAEKIILAER